MTVYVLSTMTGDVAYTFYTGDATKGELPVERKRIYIRGGAGLPSLTSGIGDMDKDETGAPIWTSEGIVTPVTDAGWADLKEHRVFKQHQENGHVKVLSSDITDSYKAIQKEVKTMEARDASAQLTPATVKTKISAKVPKVSTGEADVEDTNFASMPKIK
jgi:hypothetical protein